MVIVIRGIRHFSRRAVDSEGKVADFLVLSKRSTKVALKLTHRLLKKQGFARSQIVPDKLELYHKAFRILGITVKHYDSKRTDNRAEYSHLPVRRRERKMQKFKSTGSAQRFLNIHSATYNTFYSQRHLIKRTNFKQCRADAFSNWETVNAAA